MSDTGQNVGEVVSGRTDSHLTELLLDLIETSGSDAVEQITNYVAANDIDTSSVAVIVKVEETPQDDHLATIAGQKRVIEFLSRKLEKSGRTVVLPDATQLQRYDAFIKLCTRKFGLVRGWKSKCASCLDMKTEDLRRWERGEIRIPDSAFTLLDQQPDYVSGSEDDEEGPLLSEEHIEAIIDRTATREMVESLVKAAQKRRRHFATATDLELADALIDFYGVTIPDTGLMLGLSEGQVRGSYHNKIRKPRIISRPVKTDDSPMEREEMIRIGMELNVRKGSMQGARRAIAKFLEVPLQMVNEWDSRQSVVPSEIAQRLRQRYHELHKSE